MAGPEQISGPALPPGVTLRAAKEADKFPVIRQSEATYAAHKAALPNVFTDEPTDDAATEHLRVAFTTLSKIDGAVPSVQIAERAGQMVGYVLVDWHEQPGQAGRYAWIRDIWVSEEARGEGLGQALIAHAVALANAAQCTTISAMVWEGNAASEKMFSTSQLSPLNRHYIFQMRPNPKPQVPNALARIWDRLVWPVALILITLIAGFALYGFLQFLTAG